MRQVRHEGRITTTLALARAVESAAIAALRELRTPDVGGHATTDQVTDAVLRHLSWSRWSTDTEEEPVGVEWGV